MIYNLLLLEFTLEASIKSSDNACVAYLISWLKYVLYDTSVYLFIYCA